MPRQKLCNPPEKITGKFNLHGKTVKIIYKRMEEFEQKYCKICSVERAIQSLILELDDLKSQNASKVRS